MRAAYPRVILAALCALPLLAGCGGDGRLSKSDYEKQLNEAEQPVKTASQNVGSSIGPDSQPAVLVAPLQRFADAAGQMADKLDTLKPPKDVEALHKRLVAAIRAVKSDVEKLVAVAQSGDAAQLQQQARGFTSLPSVQQLKAVTEEMKRKGYDVEGSLGSDGSSGGSSGGASPAPPNIPPPNIPPPSGGRSSSPARQAYDKYLQCLRAANGDPEEMRRCPAPKLR